MNHEEERKIPKRVIILSFDAMGARDMEFMSTLPNFKKFMDKAAYSYEVSSVYPSITYPAHTSIVTGKKPCNHGIINNTKLQPKRPNPDWLWHRKLIQSTTLYDEVMKRGWKVASLLWPVTAKSSIQYCVPEIFANRPWQNQVVVSASNGSLFYQLELYKHFGHMMDGIRQPALDNFVHASAIYTIDKYNPDMFLIHFTDLDTNRHIYGLDHAKSMDAMRRHDKRLGEILEALEKKGGMQDTTVILLGDHCQKDTKQIVYFNTILKEKGYLTTRGEKITSYKMIAKHCDGSCYVYVHPHYKKDKQLLEDVTRLFYELKKDEAYGIERIFTRSQARDLGADDRCVMMIEAKEGTFYLDEFEVITRPVEEAKKNKMRAVHGYLPDKPDYKTFFMAAGCGIQEGIDLGAMQLYDEGMTIAKLLNLNLGQGDGVVKEEMLL